MSFRGRVCLFGILALLAKPLAAQDFSRSPNPSTLGDPLGRAERGRGMTGSRQASVGQASAGQATLPPASVCGQQATPLAQPPAGSGPVVLYIAPCFDAQGDASLIEAQTYLYYIQLKASVPSRGEWVDGMPAAKR